MIPNNDTKRKEKLESFLSVEKDKLLSEFNQIGSKYDGRSNLTKGEELEDLLMRYLENILNCGIGKGFVVNNKGEFSQQCDLILYRNSLLKFPSYLRNNNFPIELVYGIIEIKATLNKSELEDCVKKIKAFKRTISSPVSNSRNLPFGIIFAFKGSKLNTICRNYDEIRKSYNNSFYLPNFIYNLSEGLILIGRSLSRGELRLHSHELIDEYTKSRQLSVFKEKNHYSLFIWLLYELLNEFTTINFNAWNYFMEN